VSLTRLAVKNVLHDKLRALLTVLGVAVAVLAFILLRTTLGAWRTAGEQSAKDRLATRNAVAFTLTMPVRYVEQVRKLPGVAACSWVRAFIGTNPKREQVRFSSYAVDAATILDVYTDVVLPPEQRAAWLADRQGAIVGDLLASRMGWRLGDRVVLVSQLFKGDWEFTIRGIYHGAARTTPLARFLFHWQYLNAAQPPERQEQASMILSLIREESRSAEIGAAIDALFGGEEVQTVTTSERALTLSAMSMVSAVLRALDVVSVVILGIMLLILGNTIALGVQERINQYGTLRALGFRPRQLRRTILTESVAISLAGGLLGIALSYPLVQQGLGTLLEKNAGEFFPHFRIAPATAAAAVGLVVLLGLLAGALPARIAARLRVVDTLRRVD